MLLADLRELRVQELDVPDLVKSRLYDRGWFFVDDFIDKPGNELRAKIGQACLVRLHQAFSSSFGFMWSAIEIPFRPTADRPTPLWPRDASSLSWVYFIRCDEFIKIGVASDLSTRLRQLQTGNPYRIRLWLAIPRDGDVWAYPFESELHERFAASHHRGEWFRLSPEIVRFVRNERAAARSKRRVAA